MMMLENYKSKVKSENQKLNFKPQILILIINN
jgi:hypothetical protein